MRIPKVLVNIKDNQLIENVAEYSSFSIEMYSVKALGPPPSLFSIVKIKSH